LKCGYGEDWKRSAGLIKLLIRSSQESKRRQANTDSNWQKKHRWIGHILRHDGLLHETSEGRMKSKPTRGRRRIQTLQDLEYDSGFVACKRAAEDREGCPS